MATEPCPSATSSTQSYPQTQSARHVDEIKRRLAKHRSTEVKVQQQLAEWTERLAEVRVPPTLTAVLQRMRGA